MIRPPGFRGAAFGDATTGDLRVDDRGRRSFASSLGISPDWSFMSQIHSDRVVFADGPGNLGEADAVITTRPALPIAVATADCVPVILEGSGFTAVIHAGWRGAAAGVLTRTLHVLRARGLEAERAALGPSIGSCCYEVGDEVAARFPGHTSRTTWGAPSVDLAGFLSSQLDGISVWRSQQCTYTDSTLHSYRRNRTRSRQIAVAWLPLD